MKTFTYTLLLFLVLGILSKLDAQVGPSQTLTNQMEVNTAGSSYTSIDGDLTIEGNGITDLDPLFAIKSVTGNVTVRNCGALPNLSGLDGIARIGGDFVVETNAMLQNYGNFGYATTYIGGKFECIGNPALTTISVLSALDTVDGNFSIKNAGALETVDGFTNLSEVGGSFEIFSAGNLTLLGTFPALKSVTAMTFLSNAGSFTMNGFPALEDAPNGIQINGNTGLTALNGFNALDNTNSVFITSNAVGSINGFNALTSTNQVSITGSDFLVSLSGFSALQSVFGDVDLSLNGVVAKANEGESTRSLFVLNAFNNLTGINGDLKINNNGVFTGIGGFSSLDNSTNVNIESNIGLTSISGLGAYNRVRNQINIQDNLELTSLTGLQALVTIDDALLIRGNAMLTTLGNFNNVSTGTVDITNNDDLVTISGFSSHGNGIVSVTGNAELTTINAWAGISSGQGYIISMNPKLSSVSGFASFTNGVQNVQIVGNPMLSMCCWALPSIAAASSVSVSGNAAGCASVAEIDQSPTFDSCPADVTVNTDSNLCSATVGLTDPNITDNCGYTSYTYEITLGDGFNETGDAEEGFFFDYELTAGDNEFIWIVRDESGNSDGCITTVTVMDEVDPEFTTSLPTTDNTQTGTTSCMASYDVIFPAATDNCEISSRLLVAYDPNEPEVDIYFNDNVTEGSTYSISLPVGEYVVQAIVRDADINTASTSTTVTVTDGGVPTITLNQADITISCNDQVPPAAAIGSAVFASDGCDGDLTSQLSLSTSGSGSPDCIPGAIKEEIVHSYTVIDAANNISIASYKISIINDRQADLGPNRTVCPGNTEILSPTGLSGTYMWSTGATTPTIEVTSTGTYGVTVTGASGCCSEAEVTITFVDSPDASATGGVIGCTTTTVQLMGSSTTPDVDYYWTGPGGFMSEMQNPTVSSIGEYTLTVVSTASCETVVSTMVTADTDVPNASATGGTLDCSNSSVQLMGSSTTAGVTYAWTGPGGYTSNDQNPTVSAAGIYTLTVMAANGCEVTADAEVVDDTGAPLVEVEAATLTCINMSIDLMPMVTGDVATYSWSGPAGFTSSDMNISVDAAGTYTLVSTGSNDCETTTEVVVAEDIAVPNVSATGGELTCEVSELTLVGSSTTENVSYMWVGPDGYEADIQNPVAFLPGTYTLTVTAENGCEASEAVEVTSETELPVVTAEGGTVTCTVPSLMVEATSVNEGVTYSWTGPGDFTAATAVVNLTEAGTYTVMVTNSSGCSGQTTVEVVADQMVPTVEASIADLNCAMDEATAEVMVSDDVVSYAWTGPDGFSSDMEGPAISVAGIYTLEVTAENGCTSSLEIEVSGDFAEPGVEATGGMITCTDNAVSLLATTEASGVSFAWSGPDGFTSVLAGPEVSVPGEYMVIVTGENGCTSTATAMVTADSDLPNVTAAGGVLDCNNSTVTLAGSTTTEGASTMWAGPDGFTSEEADVEVTVAGEYTFTVTSSAGCSAFSTVMVSEDFLGPEVEFALGDVSCEDGTVTVLPSVVEGLSFSWTGPDGFTSSDDLPAISMGGSYMVTVTGANGCTRDTSVVLPADVAFSIEVFVDTSSASLDVMGGNGPFAIEWSDGTMSTTVVGLEDGEHSVSVTDAFGCTVVETFTTMSSSTVDLVAAAEIVAFPNPASDYITLEWSSSAEVAVLAITILDHAGRRIMHQATGPGYAHQVDVSSLPQGVYIIQVAGDERMGALKFVKL